MKKAAAPNTTNLLKDIYSKIRSFPGIFRKRVQHECAWGAPSYYRKMKEFFYDYKSLIVAFRNGNQPKPGPAGYKPLSNAEKDMIVTILNEMLIDLQDTIQQYRESISDKK